MIEAHARNFGARGETPLMRACLIDLITPRECARVAKHPPHTTGVFHCGWVGSGFISMSICAGDDGRFRWCLLVCSFVCLAELGVWFCVSERAPPGAQHESQLMRMDVIKYGCFGLMKTPRRAERKRWGAGVKVGRLYTIYAIIVIEVCKLNDQKIYLNKY